MWHLLYVNDHVFGKKYSTLLPRGVAEGGGVVRPPRAALSKEQQMCGKMNILKEKFDWLHSTNFKLLNHI
jgi:hypothetical protein